MATVTISNFPGTATHFKQSLWTTYQVISDSYDEQKRKVFDHQNKVTKIMENMLNDFEYKLENINHQCRQDSLPVGRDISTGWGSRGQSLKLFSVCWLVRN